MNSVIVALYAAAFPPPTAYIGVASVPSPMPYSANTWTPFSSAYTHLVASSRKFSPLLISAFIRRSSSSRSARFSCGRLHLGDEVLQLADELFRPPHSPSAARHKKFPESLRSPGIFYESIDAIKPCRRSPARPPACGAPAPLCWHGRASDTHGGRTCRDAPP